MEESGISTFNPNDVEIQQKEAVKLFELAFSCQCHGDFKRALCLYQKSIELYPSAEAYTFMGWTYSHSGRLDEAIQCCRRAILIDPEFGNPYNDIGCYLIDLGRYDEAIPWLERATGAGRYHCYHYPWYNLGRIYEAKLEYMKARDCYKQSLRARPDYPLARCAWLRMVAALN